MKKEAAKFTLVGSANFFLTFFVFTSMLEVVKVNYLFALGAAWGVGIIFSYALNFKWVFKPEQRLHFKARFIKFCIAGLFSITANMLALRFLVVHNGIDPLYAQVIIMPFVIVFNFLAAKYWSLKAEIV